MLLQLTLTLQIGSTKELPTLSLLALRHVWGSLKMKTPLLIQLLTWMKPSLSSNSRNKTLDEHIDCVLSLSLSAHVGCLINHICHKTSAPTPPLPPKIHHYSLLLDATPQAVYGACCYLSHREIILQKPRDIFVMCVSRVGVEVRKVTHPGVQHKLL